MGKSADDVQSEARLFPFRVGAGASDTVVRIGLGDQEFTPPEISAFILRELKRRAEEFFAAQGDIDPEVDRAVITVPAYFNHEPRRAMPDASPASKCCASSTNRRPHRSPTGSTSGIRA